MLEYTNISKQVVLTGLVFLINILLYVKAQTVKWYSFEQAVKLNKQNPKKIFIDVYTDWCGWCKRMDKVTFSNPVIAKYLNKYYITLLNLMQRQRTQYIF